MKEAPEQCETVHLGWDRHALAATVDELERRFRVGNQWDLGKVWLVVPGRRAGRRLLEMLVERAEIDHLVMSPPAMLTEGPLADRLSASHRTQAGSAIQLLAWLEAVRKLPDDVREKFLPRPPSPHDLAGWIAIARTLERLHRELAGADLGFDSVVERAAETIGPTECVRWKSLREAQVRYLATLERLAMVDAEQYRRDAAGKPSAMSQDARPTAIVMIGVIDLPTVTRRLIANAGIPVVILIQAPKEHAPGFDDFGCVRTDFWRNREIEIDDDQLLLADRPDDQARAVVNFLATAASGSAVDEITVGASDPDIVAALRNRLGEHEVRVRSAEGTTLDRTRPYRLLDGVRDLLESRKVRSLADLIRHPDFATALKKDAAFAKRVTASEAPSWFDRYWNERLPDRLLDEWVRLEPNPRGATKSLAETWRRAKVLLKPLLQNDADFRQSLNAWAEPIRDLLLDAYGQTRLDPTDDDQRTILESCEAIREVLVQIHALPADLAGEATAAEAIGLVLNLAASASVPDPPSEAAIELLGWLELRLDDAPVLAVTGFNEGAIPESINADAFLPNGLRRQLNLLDNDRRFARDAYALQAILASRKVTALIVGRRSGEGDRLTPSRLAFACPPKKIAERVRRFFSDEIPKPLDVAAESATGKLEQAIASIRFAEVDEPKNQSGRLKSLSVTGFRDYLACPFRFYLSHVEGCEAVVDDSVEMDGLVFGSLAHGVLYDFGCMPEMAAETDAEKIRGILLARLDERVANLFGGNALPAVRVQVEQLRDRLDAFAVAQARWAQDGWTIERVEVPVVAALKLEAGEFRVTGRFDRIDQHRDRNEWIIWDYKTSDADLQPVTAHRKSQEWIDLQLPLYRWLSQSIDVPNLQIPVDRVKVGYILLPSDLSTTAFRVADWKPEDFDSAFQCAVDIAEKIAKGIFWPPTRIAPQFDDFAAICRLAGK